MKKHLIRLVIIVWPILMAYGQADADNSSVTQHFNFPKEKIFVHYNSSLLFAGENLFYKIYCLNAKNKKLSDLSKVAYIELISANKKVIFKQKIRLETGLGQGDFFIPTNIYSGSYKIIAYTQWMRNAKIEEFFQSDINIINPFQENIKVSSSATSFVETQEADDKNKNESGSTVNKFLELITNGRTFSNRNQISLKIKSLYSKNSFGNYSISVRKIDIIEVPKRVTAEEYVSRPRSRHMSSLNRIKEIIHIPELRGELLSGKIISNNKESEVSNKKVALTIPGKYPIFKITNTDSLGVFHFNLKNEYLNSQALLQVINNKKNTFEMSIDEKLPLKYDNLFFTKLNITPKMKNLILGRSIQNQIENAYNEVKPNLINVLKPTSTFYNNHNVLEYILDDYTRFPTIKETVVEVINDVWLSQKKGNYTFHVRYNQTDDILPLVIVDGILIQNHNELVDFNAKKIKKISIIPYKYLYGGKLFGGVISAETLNNDFRDTLSKDYITTIELFKSENKKSYFNQTYNNDDTLDRIPDYRSQLLWEPNFCLEKNEELITFFTSDISGDFEICLEGFTKSGTAISLRKIINVAN